MSNTIGKMFRVTTWGESHGPAIGAVVDGCPAGLPLSVEDIAHELRRDVPLPQVGTPRREHGVPQILSGVFDGLTLGTPISLLLPNADARPEDYLAIRNTPRPGHADWTVRARYGHVDWRGGGRSSGRECAARVAAAAIAGKLLRRAGIVVRSEILEMAGVPAQDSTGMRCAIEQAQTVAAGGDTTGGRARVTISGVPAGIGEPVFGKLHADLGQALFTIGAVKAVEIGCGMTHAFLSGSQSNDPIVLGKKGVSFESNHAGGVLGGISNGMDIVLAVTVKPPPSLQMPQRTVDLELGGETEISVRGRFDINITPRVAVVAEAMCAIVLVDHLIRSGRIDPVRVDPEEEGGHD